MSKQGLRNIIDHLTNAHAELKLAHHAAVEDGDEEADVIETMIDTASEMIDDMNDEMLGGDE